MKTTLRKIKENHPCTTGWKKLLSNVDNNLDRELSIKEILASNGIKDAVWALRATDNDKSVRLLCADIAESVLPIFEKAYPDDNSPRLSIKAARDFANGMINKEDLATAAAAAAAAYDSATAAYAAHAAAAAYAAAYSAAATNTAADAAYAAAYSAAATNTAADAAAYAAAYSAAAAYDSAAAAYDAVADTYSAAAAARTKKWEEIEKMLLKYL